MLLNTVIKEYQKLLDMIILPKHNAWGSGRDKKPLVSFKLVTKSTGGTFIEVTALYGPFAECKHVHTAFLSYSDEIPTYKVVNAFLNALSFENSPYELTLNKGQSTFVKHMEIAG